jgi:hypothetical protein
MTLLEPNEILEFGRVLRSGQLSVSDFVLTEIDMTDPKTDELLPLQGSLTVRCLLTGRSQEYAIGDGSAWLRLFNKDIKERVFSAPVNQDGCQAPPYSGENHEHDEEKTGA